MKHFLKHPFTFAASLLCLAPLATAATPYIENFDVDTSANWTVNNNGNGTNAANFTYDYSTLGIPVAPKTTNGTTIGLKLSANISGTGPASGSLPGISVSPTGQSFAGDFKMTFDWWQNWLGSASTGISAAAGGSGSTQLSTFGILTTGTAASFAGVTDGVFFGATGDGASSQDFRTYSVEKTSGYLVADAHNVYSAGNQNSTASLYTTLFPAGVSAPAIQSTLPTGSATQAGTSVAGAAGFRWNEVEIMRLGTVVTWKINGTLIATVDTTNFTLPTGGNNVFLGMSDTSLGAGTPASLFATYDFTLIDNLAVTAVPEPSATVVSIMATFGLVASRRRRVV